MAEKKSVFEILSEINVNDKTEKKKNGSTELTYLSWSWAVAEVTKRYPDMTYAITHWDGKPYLYDEHLGYMVETMVTIEGQTKMMWLPVMDSHNAAMMNAPREVRTKYSSYTVPAATMTDINKTIMRCLTKNFAMFGLGHYIYAGEDLPENAEENEAPKDAGKKKSEPKGTYKGETPPERGTAPVTEDQVEALKNKITIMGLSVEQVCNNYHIKSLNVLNQEQYRIVEKDLDDYSKSRKK